MSSKEFDILEIIRDEIVETRKEVKHNCDQFSQLKAELRGEIVETKTDVKNLINYVSDINTKLNIWTQDGCPVGKFYHAYAQKEIDEIRADIKNNKRQSIAITAGGSIGITAIVNTIIIGIKSFFNGG